MEVVNSKQLYALIRKEFPNESQANLELWCGYGQHSNTFTKMEKTHWTHLDKADHILTSLKLSHLLSNGEIKIHSCICIGKGGKLITERNSNGYQRRQAAYHRREERHKEEIEKLKANIKTLDSLVIGYEIELGIRDECHANDVTTDATDVELALST
jgi:hypothetical protein